MTKCPDVQVPLAGFMFKDRDMKNIFMVCLALGYWKGNKKPATNMEVGINISSFSEKDLWTITAIAVQDSDNLQVINNGNEMKKIATEYAYAGLEELENLVAEYGTGENLELIIEKIARETLNPSI